MRSRGVGVSDAVYEGHVALIVYVLHRSHGGVEPQIVVQLEDAVLWDLKRGPAVEVVPVVVRNDRIEVVVPTGELEHNQYRGLTVSVDSHDHSP